MHVMGKVGVWLVVIASVAASLLTSKLIQVRDSWTKKDVTYRRQYEPLAQSIDELEDQVRSLEAQRFRALELWGNSSPPVQTTVGPQGVLTVDLGINNSFTEKKIVYGFEVQPDNSVIYRGDFTITNARDTQSSLQPNWRVRAEDGATWKSGLWRWRNQIPPAYQEIADKQLLSIGTAEDVLNDRQETAKVQTKLLAQAQEQLKLREAELVGGDQLSKDPALDIEFREGLVAGIEQVEESRNQILAKVDDLRRKLRAVQNDVDRLQKLNQELANKLPQPVKSEVSRSR